MWRRARFALLLGSLILATGSLAQPTLGGQAAPDAGATAPAEAAAKGPPAALASPRATMQRFLQAMNDLWEDPGAWDDALACLELRAVPIEERRDRARELYAVLNRIERVDVATLPDQAEADAQGLGQYRYFPDAKRDRGLLATIGTPAGAIRLGRGDDDAWRFDAATVASLPALHAQLESLPLVAGRDKLTITEWVETRLPPRLVDPSVFGLALWKWIALFGVILLGLVLDVLVQGTLRAASARLALRHDLERDPTRLRKTLRPLGLVAAAVLWLVALGVVGLEGNMALVLRGALRVFLVLAATLSAWRLIDLIAETLTHRASRSETKLDDILIPLVTRAIKIFVVSMGLIYGADVLDIPITPLLASLTVAGVGFSFAAKDTVENFFGSVAVLLDRPFDIGDWIVTGDVEGVVELVGFRSTRVRTFYNSQVSIPNSNLVRATVDNYGRRQYRRWRTTLGVEYSTPPDRLLAFTEGLRELVRSHPYLRKDYFQIWCNDFGASSIEILVYVFFTAPDWSTELRERERLLVDIMRLADALGVRFAFPTQTLHLGAIDPPGPPADPPGPQSDRGAAWEGVRAAQRLVRRQPWRSERPPPVQFTLGPTELPLDAAGNPIEPDPRDGAPPDSESRD